MTARGVLGECVEERRKKDREGKTFRSISRLLETSTSSTPTAVLSLSKKKKKSIKVAIITGAGQGLGAAAARLYASHGARVLVADLDGEKAKGVAAEINASGGPGKAAAFAGDVTDAEFAPKCVRAALDAFGGESIDILVNNAGEFFGEAGGRATEFRFSLEREREREKKKRNLFLTLTLLPLLVLFLHPTRSILPLFQATPGTAWPTRSGRTSGTRCSLSTARRPSASSRPRRRLCATPRKGR